MNPSAEYFEKNGYVVLKDALNKQECAALVQHMFKLKEEGKLTNDDQCPLSDAVYGDPIFDNILQKFAKPIGDSVGRTLLPTYTYARIYRPGEILKKHKDRPACEISATLTLGYDAKAVWPIFFDEQREIGVNLEPGELAVYKGCEVVHWRTAFKGNWHVQVFLHYVDANGPYKDHTMDGRKEFGTQKNQNVVTPNKALKEETKHVPIKEQQTIEPQQSIKFDKPIFNSIIIPNNDHQLPGYICFDNNYFPQLKFSKQECDRITGLVKDLYPSSASIGGTTENSKIAREIRSANIFILENDEENKWIFEKVTNAVAIANKVHFDYEIAGLTHGIQLIHYAAGDEVPGHYDWHVDAGNGHVATRKISFTAQLTDPNEYEGCELLINNHCQSVVGLKEQGSIHMFPGYMPHKVTPITRGERFALVIWIHGSRRFR